jgi:hypothetical protein
MTNEQINIAIAEACGWREVQISRAPNEFGRRPYGWKSTEHGNRTMETQIPDYCNDLNAMHEAEEVLTRDQIEVFCEQLLPKHHGIWWGIHTTARQRVEAFLRTIGKWEGAK